MILKGDVVGSHMQACGFWHLYSVAMVQRFSGWLSNSEFNISHMCTLTGLWTSHVAANNKCTTLVCI